MYKGAEGSELPNFDGQQVAGHALRERSLESIQGPMKTVDRLGWTGHSMQVPPQTTFVGTMNTCRYEAR